MTAKDSLGNTVTSFTGTVTLAVGTSPSGDSLHGTRSVAAVSGVATFNNVSVFTAGAGYTMNATATGTLPVTSTSFDVTPGAATQLTFTAEPMTDTAGLPIAPAVQVTAFDAHGNVATGFNGAVTIAIGTNPGGGTLTGGAPLAATAGGRELPEPAHQPPRLGLHPDRDRHGTRGGDQQLL